MLLALVAAGGAAIALADSWLDRRLPRVSGGPGNAFVAYGLLAVSGLVLIVPATVGSYFFSEQCFCPDPPVATGLALAITGGMTLAAWALRIRTGIRQPPTALRIVGGIALVGAIVLGAVHLSGQVGPIVAGR